MFTGVGSAGEGWRARMKEQCVPENEQEDCQALGQEQAACRGEKHNRKRKKKEKKA